MIIVNQIVFDWSATKLLWKFHAKQSASQTTYDTKEMSISISCL